ncbi:MAG: hypothetical protein PVF36_04310 [Desulfobacterales bacterium]
MNRSFYHELPRRKRRGTHKGIERPKGRGIKPMGIEFLRDVKTLQVAIESATRLDTVRWCSAVA